MTTYLEIEGDGWRFQPRVAAVIVEQGHVLLQRAIDGDFWVLPGGRLLPLETTEEALVRTMRWELGEQVSVRQLLWLMEYVAVIGGMPTHQHGFYYAVDLAAGSPFLDLRRDHAGEERGHALTLRWFPIDALADVALLPAFLRTALSELPADPQHLVEVEPGARPRA